MSPVEDIDILSRIQKLVDEEHEIEGRGGEGQPLKQDDEVRLRMIEEGLDQCWDLLRQRRARRSAGLDPEGAQVRSKDTVEHYQQ